MTDNCAYCKEHIGEGEMRLPYSIGSDIVFCSVECYRAHDEQELGITKNPIHYGISCGYPKLCETCLSDILEGKETFTHQELEGYLFCSSACLDKALDKKEALEQEKESCQNKSKIVEPDHYNLPGRPKTVTKQEAVGDHLDGKVSGNQQHLILTSYKYFDRAGEKLYPNMTKEESFAEDMKKSADYIFRAISGQFLNEL